MRPRPGRRSLVFRLDFRIFRGPICGGVFFQKVQNPRKGLGSSGWMTRSLETQLLVSISLATTAQDAVDGFGSACSWAAIASSADPGSAGSLRLSHGHEVSKIHRTAKPLSGFICFIFQETVISSKYGRVASSLCVLTPEQLFWQVLACILAGVKSDGEKETGT